MPVNWGATLDVLKYIDEDVCAFYFGFLKQTIDASDFFAALLRIVFSSRPNNGNSSAIKF